MTYFLDAFQCKNCFRKIFLPLSIREKTTTLQMVQSKEVRSLVLVCHVCGHGYEYILDVDIALSPSDTPDPDLIRGPDRPIVLSVQIECGEESCKFPIQVHMPWANASQISKRDIEATVSRWTLHEITCPSGHFAKLPLTAVF
jgi:hypothetical protein